MRGEARLQQQNSPALPKMNLLVSATPGCVYSGLGLSLPRPGARTASGICTCIRYHDIVYEKGRV